MRFIINAKSSKLAAVTGLLTATRVLILCLRGDADDSNPCVSICNFTCAAAPEVTIGAMAQVTNIITTVPLSIVVSSIRLPSGNIILYPIVTTASATAVCAVVNPNITWRSLEGILKAF